MKTSKLYRTVVHTCLIIGAVMCVVPIIWLFMISISNEEDVLTFGYSFIPRNLDFSAYNVLFQNISSILRAYGITVLSVVAKTGFGLVLMSLAGYVLSRPDFAFNKFFSTYWLITMLFSGGLIPSYIINTKYLGLGNNIMVYVVLGLISANNIFIFRTFFKGVPASLIEAAKIDGASELQIFVKIMIPMALSAFGSVGFMLALMVWNDFSTPMYYIQERELYNIQYYLQNIINEASFIRQTLLDAGASIVDIDIPTETLKFANCVIGILPALIIFPYFQRFFSKGMVIGSVKG